MKLRRGTETYVRTTSASIDEVRPTTWTTGVSEQDYVAAREKYQAALLEQYKIYVEMADRISARRGLTTPFS
ncbi:RipA family octameric membrane protein [Streptomyces decoyicus]|uniref:RipA family octameric membrane protein n=1 Tax=Streptomyces decoyicus TaxID=249567 RepID=UPI0033A89F06